MASPFKQKKPGKTPPKKDPPKKKTKTLSEKKGFTSGKGGQFSGSPQSHASVAVDKAVGGPAKRAIAKAIAGRTSHSQAKGALSTHQGEEGLESLYA